MTEEISPAQMLSVCVVTGSVTTSFVATDATPHVTVELVVSNVYVNGLCSTADMV